MLYKLKRKRAVSIMFFYPTTVSLKALGLIVVCLMNQVYYFDDYVWRDIFGGSITGHDEKIIRELITKGVLEKEQIKQEEI